MAPSNTEIFGAGRFTWGGGASGTQLGAPGGGGAQYPMAPSNTELFGTGTRFNWTGGAMGTQLGQATAKGFENGLNTNQLGGQIGAAPTRGLGTSITVTGGLRPGQSGGTPSGQFPGMGGGSLSGGGGAGENPRRLHRPSACILWKTIRPINQRNSSHNIARPRPHQTSSLRHA